MSTFKQKKELKSQIDAATKGHTKAMCNTDCPQAADHVNYTNSEYQPMCG